MFEEKYLQELEEGVPYHMMMTMLGGKDNMEASKAAGDCWSQEVNGKTMWFVNKTKKSRKVGLNDQSQVNMGSKKLDSKTVPDFYAETTLCRDDFRSRRLYDKINLCRDDFMYRRLVR